MSTATPDTSNTIPASISGFTVSLTGLALQPGANNLDYAVYTNPLPVPAPNWTQKLIEPKYKAAFDLNLKYTLADTVDSVSLDWLHVNNSESASVTSDGTNSSAAPPWAFGPEAQFGGLSANGTAKFNIDNGNILFSHLINIGSHIQIEPFVGINAAELKEDLTSTYTGIDPNHSNTPYSITSYEDSKFTGLGPHAGFDGTYFITDHFGITTEMAGSLLVGTMKSTTNFDASGYSNPTEVHTALADQSRTQIVPELNAKLGVTYLIPFKSGSDLSIQAGYMFMTYINGINQVVPTQSVADSFNTGVVALDTSENQESDLYLNGPYVTLAWTF